MGVRKVGPPKISNSRQVEEENPQGRADDRKYLVCRRHTRFCAPQARGT